MKKRGAFRGYEVLREPVIIHDDSSMRLPKKKGLHVAFGIAADRAALDQGEGIWVEMSRKQALALVDTVLNQVRFGAR